MDKENVSIRRTPEGVTAELGQLYGYVVDDEFRVFLSARDKDQGRKWLTRQGVHDRLDEVLDAMQAELDRAADPGEEAGNS